MYCAKEVEAFSFLSGTNDQKSQDSLYGELQARLGSLGRNGAVQSVSSAAGSSFRLSKRNPDHFITWVMEGSAVKLVESSSVRSLSGAVYIVTPLDALVIDESDEEEEQLEELGAFVPTASFIEEVDAAGNYFLFLFLLTKSGHIFRYRWAQLLEEKVGDASTSLSILSRDPQTCHRVLSLPTNAECQLLSILNPRQVAIVHSQARNTILMALVHPDQDLSIEELREGTPTTFITGLFKRAVGPTYSIVALTSVMCNSAEVVIHAAGNSSSVTAPVLLVFALCDDGLLRVWRPTKSQPFDKQLISTHAVAVGPQSMVGRTPFLRVLDSDLGELELLVHAARFEIVLVKLDRLQAAQPAIQFRVEHSLPPSGLDRLIDAVVCYSSGDETILWALWEKRLGGISLEAWPISRSRLLTGTGWRKVLLACDYLREPIDQLSDVAVEDLPLRFAEMILRKVDPEVIAPALQSLQTQYALNDSILNTLLNELSSSLPGGTSTLVGALIDEMIVTLRHAVSLQSLQHKIVMDSPEGRELITSLWLDFVQLCFSLATVSALPCGLGLSSLSAPVVCRRDGFSTVRFLAAGEDLTRAPANLKHVFESFVELHSDSCDLYARELHQVNSSRSELMDYTLYFLRESMGFQEESMRSKEASLTAMARTIKDREHAVNSFLEQYEPDNKAWAIADVKSLSGFYVNAVVNGCGQIITARHKQLKLFLLFMTYISEKPRGSQQGRYARDHTLDRICELVTSYHITDWAYNLQMNLSAINPEHAESRFLAPSTRGDTPSESLMRTLAVEVLSKSASRDLHQDALLLLSACLNKLLLLSALDRFNQFTKVHDFAGLLSEFTDEAAPHFRWELLSRQGRASLELGRVKEAEKYYFAALANVPAAGEKLYLDVIERFLAPRVSQVQVQEQMMSAMTFAQAALGVPGLSAPVAAHIWRHYIFKFALSLRRYSDAFAALQFLSNTEGQDKVSANLKKLVFDLCETGHVDVLCSLPWEDMRSEVCDLLLGKAQRSRLPNMPPADFDGTQQLHPNYYLILYSLHVEALEFKEAASAMFKYAMRLADNEDSTRVPEYDLNRECDALLAVMSALQLVKGEPVLIQTVEIQAEDEDGENMALVESKRPKPKTMVVTLDHIKRRYALASARRELMALYEGTRAVHDVPRDVLVMLIEEGLIDLALSTAVQLMPDELDLVFEGLTRKCIELQVHGNEDAVALVMDEAPLMSAFTEVGCPSQPLSASDRAANLLATYLEHYDKIEVTNFKYRKMVAESYLRADQMLTLPQWLVDMFMGRTSQRPAHLGFARQLSNVMPLLWLLLKYDSVTQACELVIRNLEYLTLLAWVNEMLQSSGVAKIGAFDLGFTDPRVWCALVNSYRPDTLNVQSLRSSRDLLQEALEEAKSLFAINVPSAQDILSGVVKEPVFIAYVQQIKAKHGPPNLSKLKGRQSMREAVIPVDLPVSAHDFIQELLAVLREIAKKAPESHPIVQYQHPKQLAESHLRRLVDAYKPFAPTDDYEQQTPI